MDQFKPEELERMEKGGNQNFNDYMSLHGIDLSLPQKIKYDNPIAEDYKQKLTCEVEGTDFVEPEHPGFDPSTLATQGAKPQVNDNIPLENRRSTTPKISDDQKEKNEAYFSKLGEKNQSRPDHLPPSKGGKYQGFGSTPINPTANKSASNSQANLNSNTLSLENLQNDPLGTLTRGWGLFSSAVTKSLDDVNETVIKPGYQQWQSGELSEETKRAASQFGQKFQETSTYGYQAIQQFTKNLQDQYVVDQQNPNAEYTRLDADGNNEPSSEQNYQPTNTKSKKNDDEWDDF